MLCPRIRRLSETVRRFETQAREYERKTFSSMALCIALVFFFYSLLFLPLPRLGYAPRESVIVSLTGMGLIVLVSLGFSWKLSHRMLPAQLSRLGLWCFGYSTFLLITIFLLWALGCSVSITPLFIIIVALGFAWLHIRQYLVYITVMLVLILASISLVEFNYFWFLEFMLLYLFSAGLHLLHVRQQCQFFEYQHLIELDRNVDGLTGLLNRRALEEAFPRLQSGSGSLAAILVDLDHFKTVNDTLGHSAGDRMLSDSAKLLRSQFRRDDYAARLGGDEFLILLDPGPEGEALLLRKLQSLLDQTPVTLEEPTGRVDITFSIGAWLGTAEACPTLEQAIAKADSAMYRVKQDGRSGALLTVEDGRELRLKGPALSGPENTIP